MTDQTIQEVSIQEVSGADPELLALLAEATLPTDDLTEPGRRFFRFSEDGQTVGFVGWEDSGTPHVLLRSTVVVPVRRGHGVGSRMILWALSRLAEMGFTDAWILTTTIEVLAQRLGFRRADRAEAPEVQRRARQFTQLCPSTATLLHKVLP